MPNKSSSEPVTLRTRCRRLFFDCGLSASQYNTIKGKITEKNEKVLYIASIATIALGAVLFVANMFSSSLAIYPCLFMMFSGVVIFSTKMIPNKSPAVITTLCYILLILLLTASAATSYLPSNRMIPATTFVAFLALIPLLTEDRPIRMAPVIAASGLIYILLGHCFKDASVLGLDTTNTITFMLIGMFLYTVMMRRSAAELWQTMHVKELQDDIIIALGTVIEARDGVTGAHVAHTTSLVDMIVDKMQGGKKYGGLPKSFFDDVRRCAALHDIGKIHTPDAILSKPAKLTPEEYEIMKQHTTYGAGIIERATIKSEDRGFFRVTYNIVRSHHERYDGKGYPDGLKGEEIPIEARIMALADVYDALVSPRPYKEAVPPEKAIQIIQEGRGTQFDPDLTDIFIEAVGIHPC